MAKHKTVMPWGKYQGVRIRHIPDDYLSWLYDTLVKKAAEDEDYRETWGWLKEGVTWEMRRRGFRTPDLELELQKKAAARKQGARKLCL